MKLAPSSLHNFGMTYKQTKTCRSRLTCGCSFSFFYVFFPVAATVWKNTRYCFVFTKQEFSADSWKNKFFTLENSWDFVIINQWAPCWNWPSNPKTAGDPPFYGCNLVRWLLAKAWNVMQDLILFKNCLLFSLPPLTKKFKILQQTSSTSSIIKEPMLLSAECKKERPWPREFNDWSTISQSVGWVAESFWWHEGIHTLGISCHNNSTKKQFSWHVYSYYNVRGKRGNFANSFSTVTQWH